MWAQERQLVYAEVDVLIFLMILLSMTNSQVNDEKKINFIYLPITAITSIATQRKKRVGITMESSHLLLQSVNDTFSRTNAKPHALLTGTTRYYFFRIN
ncbi:uncharacterized protein EV154DRAFT_511495 [Mucor mucedo]|uniref:uncharacterized protein n=1 Tax=Mucor mucedo TaxID=29922 RepID=UPI0022200E3B|nr:uncharacterized protein EV154DRAFT_511495 [Mucor mucedo]KAI7890407.1 hypothetical protein EV154DRAFT_511495 [Mucor mucedo]